MKRDRKEISRLKRENLQLRRLLEEREQEAIDRRAALDEEEEANYVEPEEKKAPRVKCPKCKGDMELIDLGGRGTYKVCTNRSHCWHREKHK